MAFKLGLTGLVAAIDSLIYEPAETRLRGGWELVPRPLLAPSRVARKVGGSQPIEQNMDPSLEYYKYRGWPVYGRVRTS